MYLSLSFILITLSAVELRVIGISFNQTLNSDTVVFVDIDAIPSDVDKVQFQFPTTPRNTIVFPNQSSKPFILRPTTSTTTSPPTTTVTSAPTSTSKFISPSDYLWTVCCVEEQVLPHCDNLYCVDGDYMFIPGGEVVVA